MKKYGNAQVWHYLCDTFDFLPIAALIDGSMFCVHGGKLTKIIIIISFPHPGLSPTIYHIDQLRVLKRMHETPKEGPLCDILWSDPDVTNQAFSPSQRGPGMMFGSQIVNKFIHYNRIESITRGHSLVMEGYEV